MWPQLTLKATIESRREFIPEVFYVLPGSTGVGFLGVPIFPPRIGEKVPFEAQQPGVVYLYHYWEGSKMGWLFYTWEYDFSYDYEPKQIKLGKVVHIKSYE
jgi:hypothetical protein